VERSGKAFSSGKFCDAGDGRIKGCQIFLGTTYQNMKNLPNDQQVYQMAINIPNGHKMCQMAIKYANIFHSKTLQNLLKMGLLV
jgi:hypothetical protein